MESNALILMTVLPQLTLILILLNVKIVMHLAKLVSENHLMTVLLVQLENSISEKLVFLLALKDFMEIILLLNVDNVLLNALLVMEALILVLNVHNNTSYLVMNVLINVQKLIMPIP
jgi:hypothetical protein